MPHFSRLAAGLLAVLALPGCAQAQSANDFYALASNLPAIADKVDGFVAYRETPTDLTGTDLLRAATAGDSDQLAPLADFHVTARQQNGFTSVLVCDRNAEHAIMEDTACTATLDGSYWQQSPPPPCDFQIDLDQACR